MAVGGCWGVPGEVDWGKTGFGETHALPSAVVSPVTEVTLDGKEVLVETLNRRLLENVVNSPTPIQHSDL